MLNLRRILMNLVSATVMRLGSAALSFVLFVYLARTWGSALLGEFATVFAFFIILQQVPLLGLHIVLIRDVAADQAAQTRQVVNATVLSLLVGAMLAVGVGLVGVILYPARMQGAMWLVGLSMLPTALVVVAESILVGRERLGVLAGMNIAENLIRVAGFVLLVMNGYGLTPLFLWFVGARVLMALGYLSFGGLGPLLHLNQISLEKIKYLFALCPTFLMILVLSSAINRIDFVLLSKLASLKDVGMYSAAYKIYEIALLAPSMISYVIFPVFARYFKTSTEQFDTLTRQIFQICFLVAMPFAIGVAFFAVPVLRGVFGTEYVAAYRVLQLLIFAPVIMALDQVLTMVLLASRRQKLDLAVLAVSASIYVVLLTVLIPFYGYVGAAVATFSAALVQLTVRYTLARRNAGVKRILPVLIRPSIAAVLMAVVMYMTWTFGAAVSLSAGLVVYTGLLGTLGVVRRGDVAAIKTLLVGQSDQRRGA